MSAAQVLAQIEMLPVNEQREVFEQLRDRFDDFSGELLPEQIEELDRRAESALKDPEGCRPLDEVVADIENRFRGQK